MFLVMTCVTQVLASDALDSNAAVSWSTSSDGFPDLPGLPDPIGFAGPFVGVVGDQLLVAGGANFPGGRPWDGHEKVWHDRIFLLSWNEQQNAPASAWRKLEKDRLPRPLGYGVSLTIKHQGENAVLCIGGCDAGKHSDQVFLLTWNGKQVETVKGPSLPRPCAYFCGAVLDDEIFVAGGREQPDSPTALKTFWSLKIDDLQKKDAAWTERDPWPGRGRMLAVAGAQAGRFYLFSGTDLVPGENGGPKREYLTDCYSWSRAKGWKRVADIPRPCVAAPTPAPAAGQSHLLVLGGDDGKHAAEVEKLKDAHPGFPNEIMGYHTITDTWRPIGEMIKDVGDDPGGDPNSGVWPPVTTNTTSWRGRIVVASGEVRPGVRTPRVLWAERTPNTLSLSALDYSVIFVYLAALVMMGVYFSRRENTTDDFFLGGRRIPWWAAGMSIFGTQLSAITFMAIPAMVYRTNWVYFLMNMTIVAAAPVVVWMYLPFYRRLNVTTAYEYLELRFDPATRMVG
ncbi:MAG: hypothetical protein N2C14_26265, partial [Planctomycetales bacterium]